MKMQKILQKNKEKVLNNLLTNVYNNGIIVLIKTKGDKNGK